jgi:ribonuclease VapC
MVVDTSVLIAILQDEPERHAFIKSLESADSLRMSTAAFVEVSIVIDARHAAAGLRDLDRLINRVAIELVPVDLEQAHLAREAFARFGKGRLRAALNYGDCFSYALAAALAEH